MRLGKRKLACKQAENSEQNLPISFYPMTHHGACLQAKRVNNIDTSVKNATQKFSTTTNNRFPKKLNANAGLQVQITGHVNCQLSLIKSHQWKCLICQSFPISLFLFHLLLPL